MALLSLAVALSGCHTPLSTLIPAGRNAEQVNFLWLVMFWGGAVVSFFVFGLAAWAAAARSRPPERLLLWGGGVIFPIATLSVLLVLGMRVSGAIVDRGDTDAFRIDVTGHQWWWEVAYTDSTGQTLFSANEVHIPVGRNVRFNIRSADVIHSFWIPRLSGKLDAIPGVTNSLVISASASGAYRGICAEFCGAQHARMSFDVYAHEEALLTKRLEQMASSARAAPAAFTRHCAGCHSVDPHARGAAPNLADLPMRRRIGAGALPNRLATLRQWITGHQRIKPQNKMAPFTGDQRELDDIIAFLEPRS